jgi:agmatinase
MATVPTFALPQSFLAIERRGMDASYCIAGVPFDLGTTNRSGARYGPAAIRRASRMLVDGAHPHWWVDPTALSVADIGDFRIALGDISKSLSLIKEQDRSRTSHCTRRRPHRDVAALASCRGAAWRSLALVHFDAHVDTWPDNFGQRYAHGSVLFNTIEERLIDPQHAVQIGIRSPVQKEIYDWTLAKGVTIITAQDVHELGPTLVAERAAAVVGNAPAYLSFDIDVLDPAFAPGTGTPEI